MSFLKSLGGEQPDYALNGLLRPGTDPIFKTAVNQSYGGGGKKSGSKSKSKSKKPIKKLKFKYQNITVNQSGGRLFKV